MTGSDKPRDEPRADDPEALARELELELMQQRAAWRKSSARRGTWRALGFLFLLLVVIATLFACLYLLPQLRSRAADKDSAPIGSDR